MMPNKTVGFLRTISIWGDRLDSYGQIARRFLGPDLTNGNPDRFLGEPKKKGTSVWVLPPL